MSVIIINLDTFSDQLLIYLAQLDITSFCIDYPNERCKITVIPYGPMSFNLKYH